MTDVDWELLFRYYGNECNAEERERFERWLATGPRRRVLVDAATTAADRTLAKSRSAPPLPPRLVPALRRPGRRWTWPLAAAATLLVVVAGALVSTHPRWIPWRTTRPESELHETRTVAGERRELRLSDGTRVVLGPASTLRHPDAFGAGAREVHLEGEAYFEVAHDAAHAFRVHAAHATAEDLGTAFGVIAYPGDSTVRVVVAEGSVSLGAATRGPVRGARLDAGDLGSLAKGAEAASVHRVDLDAWLAWTHGRLVFDETPLPEVAARLGRWYGTPVRLADSSLAERTLTASFTTESLAGVLAAVAPVLDVRFERAGDTVVVHRR